jgi:predicted glycosyltransferase
MTARVKALFYGINGTGLGHISRLLNVAREARELLHAMGVLADFHFITTSEAPQIAWDFPVTKLPSKTVVAESDTPNAEFVAHSRFLISNIVGTVRPDILVMDTAPQGSFNEFLLLRDFCKRTTFINRHKDTAAANDALHQQLLPMYDLILTPDDAANAGRYVLPESIADRHEFTGAIHGYRAEAALAAEEFRNRFGSVDGRTVVYVSAGGGGDRSAETELRQLISTLSSDERLLVLVGYGPLYRGEKLYRTNVIPLTDTDNRTIFPHVDLAFSAAGYNTYHELLAAGVPTAFYAQTKGMDRQDERIALGAEQGWHLVLRECTHDVILHKLSELMDDGVRHGIREALAKRDQGTGSIVAAEALLRLHATIKGSPVETDRLAATVALRTAWSAHWGRQRPTVAFDDAVRCLAAWQESSLSPYAQMLGSGALASRRPGSMRGDEGKVRIGVTLATLRTRLAMTHAKFRSLVRQYAAVHPVPHGAEPDAEAIARFHEGHETEITEPAEESGLRGA